LESRVSLVAVLTRNLILEAHELGRGVTITSGPRSGDNLDLNRVGESFGVYKLRTDLPHWSHNGQ